MKKTKSSPPSITPDALSSRKKQGIRILSAAVAATFACATAAHALDATWTGTSSGTWSTASNWLETTAAGGAGYTAVFAAASGSPTITLDASTTVGNLTFSNSGRTYTIAGANTLTIDNGANLAVIQVDSGVSATIGGGSLVFSGSSNINKTGAGTLTISSDNTNKTYTGSITVSNGKLVMGGSGALRYVPVILDSSVNDVNLTWGFNNSTYVGGITVAAGGVGTASIFYLQDNTNTLSTSLTLNKNLTIAADHSATGITLNGVISGTGAIVKTGTGQLNLTGASNSGWSGGVIVSQGSLRIYGNGSSAGTGKIIVGDANTGSCNVSIQFGQTFTTWNSIVFTNNGTGSASISNAVGFGTGNTLAGTIQLDRSIAVGLTGTISGVISGMGGIRYSGATVVTGANTYTGVSEVTGLVKVSKMADGGQASSLGASSRDASNLVLNSGTLVWIGSTASTDRLFTLGSGTSAGMIKADGSGALNFTNTGAIAFSGTGNRTLTLSGTGVGANSLAAQIADAADGLTSLVKSGTGTWVLAGSNTYTGNTDVTAGTLSINGSIAEGSAVTVAAAAILNGSGTVYGAVANSGTISGGLTFANDVTVNSGAVASAAAFNGNVIDNGSITGGLSVQSGKVLSGSGAVTGAVSVLNNGGINGSSLSIAGTTTFQGNGTLAGRVTSSGGFNVAGSSTLNVTGTTSSGVNVNNATVKGTGTVGNVVLTSGTLTGTLVTGTVGGSGVVAPGNSPGILTVSAIASASSLSFAFELTTTTPDYGSATNSLNDIVHVTSSTGLSLTDANSIAVYFSNLSTALTTYDGGFFVDGMSVSSLLSAVSQANISYYQLDGDGLTSNSGDVLYNGLYYKVLDASNVSYTAIELSGIGFSTGEASGAELQFTVVPEPSTWAMIIGGVGMLIGIQRLRKDRMSIRPGA